jgi:acetate kinase
LIATDLDLIAQNADRRLAKGTIERIGGEAIIRLQVESRNPQRTTSSLRDINAAVDFIARWAASAESGIEEIKSIADIQAVGHRVVHGGERFKESVLITDEVVRAVEDCIDLAPLHNPANLTGISATRKLFGDGLPQVAVFDTAFHQTLPDHAFLYALPYQLYRRYRLRRYGFHE